MIVRENSQQPKEVVLVFKNIVAIFFLNQKMVKFPYPIKICLFLFQYYTVTGGL